MSLLTGESASAPRLPLAVGASEESKERRVLP